MYIVQGEQAQLEYLVGDEEVSEVRPAESGAGRAMAIGVERPRVGAIFGALDVEAAVVGGASICMITLIASGHTS